MSRKIDVSNPDNLSAEDRKYLQDRARLPRGVRLVRDDDLSATASSPADDSNVNEDDEDVAYEDMSKEALQKECAERDLPTSGNVKTLIARLVEDDEAEDDEADAEGSE